MLLRLWHRLRGTRKWRHYQQQGHWPDIRSESQVLDSNVDGFTVCVRCNPEYVKGGIRGTEGDR